MGVYALVDAGYGCVCVETHPKGHRRLRAHVWGACARMHPTAERVRSCTTTKVCC